MLESMLDIQKAVLLTGNTGVGKSVFVNNLLFKLKDVKGIVSIMLNCSAQTKARDTQLAI
jgi:dynein heavy chain